MGEHRVTIGEAASRLGMSPSWLKSWAKDAGIRIERRDRPRGEPNGP